MIGWSFLLDCAGVNGFMLAPLLPLIFIEELDEEEVKEEVMGKEEEEEEEEEEENEAIVSLLVLDLLLLPRPPAMVKSPPPTFKTSFSIRPTQRFNGLYSFRLSS